MNVGIAVTRSARKAPDSIAAFDDDRELTYRELDERTSRLANAFHERYGLERGDRVALLVHNRIAVLEVLAACAKAGVTYCGLNFRLGLPEYEDIFANAEPRLLITEPEFAEIAAHLRERQEMAMIDVDDPGPDGYEAVIAAAPAHEPKTLHEVRPEDDFAIVYTSGTTGQPKGVYFDHSAAVLHAAIAALEYEVTSSSRWMTALPHNSTVFVTSLPLLTMGGAMGFAETRGFDAERFAANVRKHGATHTFLVPTMLFRVLDAGLDGEAMPTLKTIGYGSSPIPPERVKELVRRFGPIFTQVYGMAEVASIGTMLRKDDHLKAMDDERLFASCGTASYAMDVRVVDESGADVGPGERGEVIFGSPHTMKSYYRDPERTAAVLIDGWMHSGDIGEWDDDGYLYIVDRMKDMIIRGGHNILPSEIENVLYSHPAVLEAAVIGLPDDEWGESVAAGIALRDGTSVEAEELQALCRSAGLSSIKVPARIEFLDVLPKNAVGKIAKRSVKEQMLAS